MASSLLLCFILSLLPLSSSHLLLPLSHSLSTTHFNSTHNLLKSATARSAARFHRRHRHVSLPLSPGSDYTLTFNLGSHRQPISLYMDTGSDLVWFPCHPFECILCEGKPKLSTPIPTISDLKPVTCSAAACSAAHSALSSSALCAISRCPLDMIETSDCSSFSCPPVYYAYGDGSLIAELYKDVVVLAPRLEVRDFTFGCAHTTLGEPIGVAGFGRGLLSMPNQLAAVSPKLGSRFSYCLVSHSFESDRVRRPSPLILGRYDEDETVGDGEVEFVYTELLDNPKHPYYYSVGLVGISVGKVNIPAPEFLKRVDATGGGGLVVDSGTTFTMLPGSLYNSVVAQFEDRVGRVHERANEIEDKTGLSPCYYYQDVIRVPAVTLHFAGENSSVTLPRKNYFYEFIDGGDGTGKKRRVGCLMLMNGGDEKELSGGPGATLGNYQQQGFEVVYDLEKRRVGFARRQCALLWDSLNRS